MINSKKPGTYALLLKSEISEEIQIGRWGKLQLEHGYYLYIGGAFGSGGVYARVSRHFRQNKKLRWHIDYLRAATLSTDAWFSLSENRLEHEWAETLSQLNSLKPIRKFGCSDCKCLTHLFFFNDEPQSTRSILENKTGSQVSIWSQDVLPHKTG